MASKMTTAASTNTEEIAAEIPTIIRQYKDGRVERLVDPPFTPPPFNDSKTGVSCRDIVIAQDRSLYARIYLQNSTLQSMPNDPNRRKVPILVYYHGGAFSVESSFNVRFHGYISTLVSMVNVLVVSVNYRKAPEYPLPTGYEDCWFALQWVGSHLTDHPTNPDPWLIEHGDFSKIFIAGDSNGGNITHNMAMRAGSEALPGGVKLYGAYVAHPLLFGSNPVGSEPDSGPMREMLSAIWEFSYPTAPGGLDNPMLNPIASGAPSLAGLGCSKLLVSFAGDDIVRDRTVLYCEAVKKSGWEGEFDMFELEGAFHGLHIHEPESEKGKKMMTRFASFLLD